MEKLTHEQAKDQIAKKYGYLNWEEFEVAQVYEEREDRKIWTWVLESKHWKEAAELYADSVARDAFDAARKRINHPDWDYIYDSFEDWKSQKL